MVRKIALTLFLMFLAVSVQGAESIEGEWAWTPDTPQAVSEPPMWDALRQLKTKPLVRMASTEEARPRKLQEVSAWNRQRVPLKNGISHSLGSALRIEIDPFSSTLEAPGGAAAERPAGDIIETSNGDIVWSGSVHVDNAHRLRLHLGGIDLPDGALMWVYGENDEMVGPFGAELADDEGNLYTPSVSGSQLTLVVLVPRDGWTARFDIGQVVEIFKLDSKGHPISDQTEDSHLGCLEDAQCVGTETFGSINDVERAIALISYMRDGESFICSGGLINDTVEDSLIPYFLTANHCLSTQSSASSVEAFWDYKPSSCGGSTPGLGSVPRTNGAKLLVTGAADDFTLLELNAIPPGRRLLGWHTGASEIGAGRILHRVSHPEGGVQSYSQTRVDDGLNYCGDWPRETSIYQSQIIGGTAGGSSGSPVLNASGQILGQNRGHCGENLDDDCDYATLIVDGSLRNFWSSVSPFLKPEDTTPADLAVQSVDVVNGSYAHGSDIVIDYIVRNVGGTESDGYRITFYASSNTTITSSDYQIGYIENDGLLPSAQHDKGARGPIPQAIPEGQYFIGAILTIDDSNSSNNVNYDATPITITSASPFLINPGLNGAWFNPQTNGQGFFLDVFPNSGTVFLSWFTFDTPRPPTNYIANLGEPGQRWLTAQGPFNGSSAMLDIYSTEGGVFDTPSPVPNSLKRGTIILEFSSCRQGTVRYGISGIADNRVIPIQRVAEDNVGLCESLNQASQSSATEINPSLQKLIQ